jgi:hypothetical protein
MAEVPKILILLAVCGVGVALLGAMAAWWMDEGRQARRGLKVMLQGDTHGLLVARGRGRAMGMNFAHNRIAVAWDRGAWGLVYRIEELIGAEAIVDDRVVARVHRGEARQASDVMGGATQRVALRLLFNDVTHADFMLDLWLPQDEGRRDALSPAEAVEEANRWLARIEALFRQPKSATFTSSAPSPQQAAPPPERPSMGPLFDPPEDRDDLDDDEDHGDRRIT